MHGIGRKEPGSVSPDSPRGLVLSRSIRESGETLPRSVRYAGMTGQRKSWREKLATAHDLPKVVAIPARMQRRLGRGTMVIASPREVDAIMRRVRSGRTITQNEIRAKLARRYATTTACPITTGIFTWIAAHAAEEDRADGARTPTPYWRTLKVGGELNPKYPGGVVLQRRRLEQEGWQIEARGRRHFVAVAPAGLKHQKRSRGKLP